MFTSSCIARMKLAISTLSKRLLPRQLDPTASVLTPSKSSFRGRLRNFLSRNEIHPGDATIFAITLAFFLVVFISGAFNHGPF